MRLAALRAWLGETVSVRIMRMLLEIEGKPMLWLSGNLALEDDAGVGTAAEREEGEGARCCAS